MIERILFGLVVLLAALVVATGAIKIVYLYQNPCVRTERRMVHHDGWVMYVSCGDNCMSPIFIPATDGIEPVCVERRRRG